MSVIQFKEANCKNCYKCIRSCPVKAIAFRNDQAEIVEEDCMLCGNCFTVCSQNAKTVKSEIGTVKSFIEKNEKVYASLAPSFVSAFENTDEKLLFSALKRLGFTYVEETAVGAAEVSRQYEQLLKEKKMKNIITTACPSIVYLVQKYYPELIDNLAPVVSPMVAHAKILREVYGARIRVIFIGPCISKKEERNDIQNRGAVDAVITFEELENWMVSEGVCINGEFSREIKASKDTSARIYPAPGGILKTIDSRYKKNYRFISVDGVERCIKILESIKNDEIKGYFLEMSSCTGGCIGGPCMKHIKGGYLEARERLIEYVKKVPKCKDSLKMDLKVDLNRKFFNLAPKSRIPSEEIIQGILNSIGKFSKDKELNCGACGYPTCRDKAAAVYNNKAQLHMCLPYMRERAESISNLIINTTPNAILALDNQLRIQEFNIAAQKILKLNEDIKGKRINEILQCEDFIRVQESKESIYESNYYYEGFNLTVEQSIIYVAEQNIIVVIIKDISEAVEKRRQMHILRTENAKIAQKVIEKQMRVAQEIASLLGETTAETKVALTKLKKSIIAEMGDTE